MNPAEPPPEQTCRARSRALRAARVATLALALGGCYAAHEAPPDVPEPPPVDAAVALDAGPPSDCVPDPDCSGAGGGDGACDYEQFDACCEERGWGDEPCFLPGGPMRPPEMQA